MISQESQEKLVGEIHRAALEAISLHEGFNVILPLLEQLFGSSGTNLYRCGVAPSFESLGGSLGRWEDYVSEYHHEDVMQTVLQRENPWVFQPMRFPEWEEYRKSPTHAFSTKLQIAKYLHVRLTDTEHQAPGMVGILIARSKGLSDFTVDDELLMARLVPSLRIFVQRSRQIEWRMQVSSALETLINEDWPPKLVLDANGSLIWASTHAVSQLGMDEGCGRKIPEAMVRNARRFGGLKKPTSGSSLPFPNLNILCKGKTPVRVEMRPIQDAFGGRFILCELWTNDPSPAVEELARAAHLTPAESEVLVWLTRGLSNREIAEQRFVSLDTVHTHVQRILSKLGVDSRVRAILLALGHRFEQ